MSVLLETSLGDITIDLYTDLCPKACKNFLKLCLLKSYNNSKISSIQRNFIANITNNNDTNKDDNQSFYEKCFGPQAKFFDDEIHTQLTHAKKGTVGMSHVDDKAHTNSKSFYITLSDGLHYLDGKYSIFGNIVDGIDVIDKINNFNVDHNFSPMMNIKIRRTIVLHDPYPTPSSLSIPPLSPPPIVDPLDYEIILAEESMDNNNHLSQEEIQKINQKKENQSKAVVLEMIGDLPSADIAPPETVLFVCKLNKVTDSEDLELYFGRFGNIVECSVVKDWKTGESLQYAFIEYETKESCEKAYFKMNNALLDDRRIKVDFSQSVSKLWNQHRRNKFNKNNNNKNNNITKTQHQNINHNNQSSSSSSHANTSPSSSSSSKYHHSSSSSKSSYDRHHRHTSRSRSRSRSRRSRSRSRDKYSRDKHRSKRSRSRSKEHHRDKHSRRSRSNSKERSHRR